mgnify:CR=1 FL=1
MTYIIIQMEDPLDLENISVMPDEQDLKIKQFLSEEDAVRFLVKHDMQDELLYDAKIVMRLGQKILYLR